MHELVHNDHATTLSHDHDDHDHFPNDNLSNSSSNDELDDEFPGGLPNFSDSSFHTGNEQLYHHLPRSPSSSSPAEQIAMDETLLSTTFNDLSMMSNNSEESGGHRMMEGDEMHPKPYDDDDLSIDISFASSSTHDSFSLFSLDERNSSDSFVLEDFFGSSNLSHEHGGPFNVTFNPRPPDEDGIEPLDELMVQSADLLSILKKSNAPLQLYNKIADWCKRYYSVALPKRSSVLKYFSSRYNLDRLWPIKKPCYLPGSGKIVSVVVFDMKASLESLLSDPVLMSPDNLTIDLNDPHKYPPVNDAFYDELTSGSCYEKGYKKYCANDPAAVGAFLVCFSDSTPIDMHGHLSNEPITYTLSIFKENIRKRPEAWRVMGYVRNKQTKLEETEADRDIENLDDINELPKQSGINGKSRVFEHYLY